jgi:hypothetical protein
VKVIETLPSTVHEQLATPRTKTLKGQVKKGRFMKGLDFVPRVHISRKFSVRRKDTMHMIGPGMTITAKSRLSYSSIQGTKNDSPKREWGKDS